MIASRIIPIVLSLAFLSGCSIIMAASAEDEPNLSAIEVGMSRSTVEQELDNMLSSVRTREGKMVTYQYFTGDEKSYGRAVTYVVLDVLTVGVAELITTPIETLKCDKHVIEITYDFQDRVKSIKHSVINSPTAEPKQVIETDESDTAIAKISEKGSARAQLKREN